MKTDRYTKAVLTIIAIALICIVFQNYSVVPSINASVSKVPVITQTNQGVVDVRIVDYRHGVEFPVGIKSATTIPVKVESYSSLPVSIESVRTTVPVRVENRVSISN
jgi:hypothetical protein